MSRPAEEALAGFFEQAAREHARAMDSAGEVDRELCLGDRRVRLRFAGPALAHALTDALRPRLAANAGPVHATIGLWEESRSPGGASPVPWRDVDLGARGLLRGPDGARVIAVHEAGSGALTLVDRPARELLYRVPDASTLPWWERAAPLRPALFWALSGPGRHLVHAGAVGDEQRGAVLLAGAGGSGKTTVALAALTAGMAYLADDYLLLHTHPEPVAWNMYGTAKLDAGHLARFPQLAGAVSISADPVADEKAVLDVQALLPHALASSLPIRAVLLPRIRGGRARLRRASAGEALLALAPSTTFQMPFDDGQVVSSLAAVARRVPAFGLDVGDDPDELAQALEHVLDNVCSGGEQALDPAPEPAREGLAL
jgi:hypothetical protein